LTVPRARKRFGQHFLEAVWSAKVLRAIAPQPTDVFLEIGPGRGALTRSLVETAAHVVAVEIDRDLAAALRSNAGPQLTIVQGDFLALTPGELRAAFAGAGIGPRTPVRVAGNLPYNVASPILFRLLDLRSGGLALADATVMLQREVAERLLAPPGTRDYGVLSILIQHQAAVRAELALPPGAFRPVPKVASTLVRLRFHPPEPAPRSLPAFTQLVKAVFTRRRKTLANALSALNLTEPRSPLDALRQAGIDGRRRPETLSIAELVRLSDAFTGAVL